MKLLIDASIGYSLADRFPGRIGFINTTRFRNPKGIPFALDNGRYGAWFRNQPWCEKTFLKQCERAAGHRSHLLWVAAPDAICDAIGTFQLWQSWAPRIESMGFPVALVVQDGMTVEAVQREIAPRIVFVGGSTEWKVRTMWQWCQSFPIVHVGRVNSERRIWDAHRCGATSCDGSGWFRRRETGRQGIIEKYLERSSAGMPSDQMELAFANSFRSNDDE